MNVLAEVLAVGGHLGVHGDKLRYELPEDHPDLLEELRADKPRLLPLLRLCEVACKGLSLEPAALAAELAPGDVEVLLDGACGPETLQTFATAVCERHQRERGEVPSYYTAQTLCAGCGLVPIFPSCPDRVTGCPWCWNRLKGLPVPTLTEIVL